VLIVGILSLSPQRNRNSSQRKGILTNQSVVFPAVRQGKRIEVEVAGGPGPIRRDIRQFVHNAVKKLKFLSSRDRVDRYTAATAIARSDRISLVNRYLSFRVREGQE
jgi:hypothetical protein